MNPSTEAGSAATTQPAEPGAGFFSRHPIGFWFFFWGELAERSSYYGMRAILTLYMTERLGFSDGSASQTMAYFIAGAYFLPLLGGYVADNFLGKYWTIVGFSLPYILGHVILGVESTTFLYIALVLLAMGSGVIKPNISTLMGMTYDQQRPGQEKLRSDAFAMFYWAINIGAALSSFAMPLIRTRMGYAIAFLFPAALMVVAFAIFAVGKRFYAVEVISRKSLSSDERAQRLVVLRRILGLFLVIPFFWSIFDQAASTWTLFARDYLNLNLFGVDIQPDMVQGVNPILIILLLPPVTLLWKYLAHKGWELRATDKMLIGFLLTMATMGVMSAAGFWSIGAIERYAQEGYTLVLLGEGGHNTTLKERLGPSARVFTVNSVDEVQALSAEDSSKIAYLTYVGNPKLHQRVGEGKDRHERVEEIVTALRERFPQIMVPPKVSVLWEVVAYVIMTIAEICISVSGLELAFTAAPQAMKSFVTACWLLTVFLGNMLNSLVTPFYETILPGRYFGLLSLMMIPVTLAFFAVGRRLNRSASRWQSEAIGEEEPPCDSKEPPV